jgi:pyrroloquinoline quinone (PQQ) biosynthesis protein C
MLAGRKFQETARLVQAAVALTGSSPSLRRFQEKKTPKQIRRFAAQWYITAAEHKRMFPSLIYITENDYTRQELIEILRDEYGNGDKEKIHSRLLAYFLMQLPPLAAHTLTIKDAIPEVREFAETTERMWVPREGSPAPDPIRAFGYHYALETLATTLHRAFYQGLREEGFSKEALAYFRLHAKREAHHAALAAAGLRRYESATLSNYAPLLEGARDGCLAVRDLLEGFNRHVFRQPRS